MIRSLWFTAGFLFGVVVTALGLLRHDHRWQNLAEGLTGGRA